ncbi:hypothetical protein OH768_11715 [Streptomyces sp. NBC_01622]|uniref:arsenate-mycothiol transferase ArsC n=1 Tax=Streptomyces sp. NBC_01622 TaxID=2975903 RepID=UPI0038697439|nr:hypothetical protein OH768_11715 [Streptomyces sp. NBC_01622]
MTASPLPVLPTDPYARLAEPARVRTHLVVVAEHLAAALLAHRAGGHAVVSSARTRAAAEVEPVVAQAPTEAGVDLTDVFPEPLTDQVVRAADIVITMGCGGACPVVPDRRYVDWSVNDPEGAPIAVVRGVRDEIDAHITELLDSLPST